MHKCYYLSAKDKNTQVHMLLYSFLAEQVLFALSGGSTSWPADVVEQSACPGALVDGCRSTDSFEGQHYRLQLDVGCNRKPVEVTEEGGHMGEFG